MRTQLLFALAVVCGGAAVSAQQPPALAPADGGVRPAVAVDVAGSFKQYAAGSAKAASAASMEDAKEAGKIQLTSGVTPVADGPAPYLHPIPAEPVGGDHGPVAGGFAPGGGAGGVGWFTASGMVGWARAIRLPTPLVTTSLLDPSERFAGSLRFGGTLILFGDQINFHTYYGGQASAGIFLDDSGTFAGEVRGFYLRPNDVSFSANSDAAGSPFITRPFFNLVENREAAVFDAKPGVAAGGVDISSHTEFWGFEVNSRANFGNTNGQGVSGSVLAGYRFLRLGDTLVIRDRVQPLVPNQVAYRGQPVNPPNTINDEDNFRTHDNFNGFQLGGQVNWEASWLSLSAYAKLAVGVTEQHAEVSGFTTLTTPAGTDTTAGGVLALSSNIGKRSVNVFGLVPEWGLTLGASLTQNLRVTVGYSFLLWNRVARPGDVIDRGLNPALIPTDGSFGAPGGPDRPALRFANNDNVFWMHTANAGIELIF